MQNQHLSDDFIGQRQRRIANLNELIKRGIICYPAQSKKEANHATIHAEYESRKGTTLTLAGRIMKWRAMGKLIFADIIDQTERMQICVRKDAYPSEAPSSKLQAPNNDQSSIVNEIHIFAKDDSAAVVANDAKDVAWQSRQNQTLTWNELKFIDLGDFVQVTGLLEKTQAGEVTLFATEIVLLSKSLRPYPNQLEDKDERYRRRYVDMVLHPKVRDVMSRKATFWQTIRNVLVARGFTEIFLPVLEHTTGGADAKPFVTHHNSLDENLYLRISLELYSKRAIGAGFEKVFAIGPVFRNEGMSDEHANEFNHVEWYWAYADYRDQMELTKQVIIETAQAVYGTTKFTTRGHSFDLADTWKEIDYTQVIKDTYGIDIFTASDDQIKKVALSHGIELEGGAANRQRMIDSLWKLVRKTISGPAFLIHEPAFMSPLAKAKTDNPLVTERFHIILAGTEAANGYSEINDPQYQLQQFLDQQKMRDSGDDEAQMLDIDFIEMLEYGMPPTTGLGFSERLFWFFEDITAREGAMFPILRNEVDPLTRKIYSDVYKTEKSQSQDFGKKIVIVVDDTLPQWQIANAVSHVSAYIGNKLTHTFATGETFVTSDGKVHPRNAQYPVAILRASKNALSLLISEVRKSKLLYHGFIREMIETTNDSNIEKLLANKQDSQIDYLAIGVFGEKEQLQSLTGSFELYGNDDAKPSLDIQITLSADPAIEKFLIFDFDGVLADTWDEMLEALVTYGLEKDHDTAIIERIRYFSKKPNHARGIQQSPEDKARTQRLLDFTSEHLIKTGFELFDDFIEQVALVPNKKVAIVTSNTKRTLDSKVGLLTKLAPTHILTYDDSPSKEEKVETVCKDWGVSLQDVYYFTDSLADVYELEKLIKKSHIIGCGWGYLGEMWLKKELPDKQILKRYSDIHRLQFDQVKSHKGVQMSDSTTCTTPQITREKALSIVESHITNPGLRKHCLSVEAAMGALYDHFAQIGTAGTCDRSVWTLAGLLHDADWEVCKDEPSQHTLKTLMWLRDAGVQHNQLIDAILSHAHHVTSYRLPESTLEWSLYCCDELTGLIVANALILPSKKLADVTVESVIKKMSSKSFAAAIDREGIRMCEEKLGIKLEEFVGVVLKGMQNAATSLGL